jgi:hypothetical protein
MQTGMVVSHGPASSTSSKQSVPCAIFASATRRRTMGGNINLVHGFRMELTRNQARRVGVDGMVEGALPLKNASDWLGPSRESF